MMSKPMTNFNEKLDDVVSLIGVPLPIEQAIHAKAEAKQAITSLYKELVAEAKPLYYVSPDKSEYQDGFNTCIRLFEQNLLKALEEN